MQVASVAFTLRKQYRWRGPDTAMLWAHFAIYYRGPAFTAGTAGRASYSSWSTGGCWGCFSVAIFAPNHKGMLVISKEDAKLDFLLAQVLTSRNVRSTPLIDFLYGGLNHQAVHHLFPNMSRNKLRAAGELTRQFCDGRDIPYYMTGVRQSFREILQCLHETSGPLRWSAPTETAL